MVTEQHMSAREQTISYCAFLCTHHSPIIRSDGETLYHALKPDAQAEVVTVALEVNTDAKPTFSTYNEIAVSYLCWELCEDELTGRYGLSEIVAAQCDKVLRYFKDIREEGDQ